MKVVHFLLVLLLAKTAEANYCNREGCNGRVQGCCSEGDLAACNSGEDTCENSGICGNGAEWCTNTFDYCSWNGCNGLIESTEYCNGAQDQCENVCGGQWCTNGGLEPVASPTTPAPFNAQSGMATTTRYWDCSGGACGCGYGNPSSPVHCSSNGMFAAPAGNPYGATYYGTAAVSPALFDNGGSAQWLGSGCGTCYKVTGTSNTGVSGVETTVVLKAANLCPTGNPVCQNGNVHFDIAAPGFDFRAASLSNTCDNLAEAAAFLECQNWPAQDCDCSLFQDPTLQAGCSNFKSLNWNNPMVAYEAVACPMELDQLSCWEENGNMWPPANAIPEFCAINDSGASPSPVTPAPTPAPVDPTPDPTPAPVTPQPTPAPIDPTPDPTPAPITPQPTPAPVDFGYCCSNNFKDCNVGGWCGATEERCTGCGAAWIPDNLTCDLPLWAECTHNTGGCCPGSTCQGANPYYMQCRKAPSPSRLRGRDLGRVVE